MGPSPATLRQRHSFKSLSIGSEPSALYKLVAKWAARTWRPMSQRPLLGARLTAQSAETTAVPSPPRPRTEGRTLSSLRAARRPENAHAAGPKAATGHLVRSQMPLSLRHHCLRLDANWRPRLLRPYEASQPALDRPIRPIDPFAESHRWRELTRPHKILKAAGRYAQTPAHTVLRQK